MSRPAPSTIMPRIPRFFAKPAHQTTADGDFSISARVDNDNVAWLAHLQCLQGIDEVAFR